jgi:hypothetical protein
MTGELILICVLFWTRVYWWVYRNINYKLFVDFKEESFGAMFLSWSSSLQIFHCSRSNTLPFFLFWPEILKRYINYVSLRSLRHVLTFATRTLDRGSYLPFKHWCAVSLPLCVRNCVLCMVTGFATVCSVVRRVPPCVNTQDAETRKTEDPGSISVLVPLTHQLFLAELSILLYDTK